MRSLRKKLFSFVLQIIQSLLILFFLIVGLALLSRFIMGARQVNIFNDAWDMFESVYVESYKFHFANISFLFIILSCRFIEKEFVSKMYLNIIVIIVINVFLSLYIFYAFDFNRDLYNKLSSTDLIITALVILFSQIISLYYSVNSNINKKYIQRIYNVNDNIFWYSLILYLYYCQYSYFLIFERMGMMFLMIPVILLFLFLGYNVFLVCQMNYFCKNIKLIPIDSFVYIYC